MLTGLPEEIKAFINTARQNVEVTDKRLTQLKDEIVFQFKINAKFRAGLFAMMASYLSALGKEIPSMDEMLGDDKKLLNAILSPPLQI